MSNTSNNDFLGNLVLRLTLPEKVATYEVIVKSKLLDKCNRFSANFCNSENIVYHFGWDAKKLYQGARSGTEWRSRNSCEDCWECPKTGIVEQVFKFKDKAEVKHNGNYYDFSHEIPFHAIQHLELRGDIECVQEVVFRWNCK